MKHPALLQSFAAAFFAGAASLMFASTPDKVVSVDFNVGSSVTFVDNFNGTSATPLAFDGSYWNGLGITGGNQFSPGSFTSSGTLLASDGSTGTSLGFSVTFGGAYQEMRFPGNANYTTSVLEDFAFTGSGVSRTLTITGLQANAQYDVYLYSMNARYGSNTTAFSVSSTYSSTGSGLSLTATNAGDNTTFTAGVNYVAFTSLSSNALQSDGSGNLVINWAGSGAEGAFNGFQIVLPAAIPEPASAATLAGCALFGFVALRRRHRAA